MSKSSRMVKKIARVDEYEHIKEMHYSPDIDYILKEHVKILVDWINTVSGAIFTILC